MSVTNAISSVIIVGAIVAALAQGGKIFDTANIFGYLAIVLAAVNIFGGFLVTQRMLAMYKKKRKNK
jgi:NAD(P) transhydrogenase subunit alpha